MTDSTFSARAFREALSTFATGVTIITAQDAAGEPVGMTASSFNSVSMEPPLVLWSVTKTALSAQAFHDAQHFAIHVLAADQVDLSNRFASRGADKFAGLQMTRSAHGVPCINGVVTRFDCTQWAVYEGGDHWIIVGEVTSIDSTPQDSLVFGNGAYATATPIRSPQGEGSEPSADDFETPIDGLLIYHLARAYQQLGKQFHDAVRESGLTVPEWRVLASLHGGVTRTIDDLAARTFVDPKALHDMLADMAHMGLCSVDRQNDQLMITGTDDGEVRVSHLFALGRELEAAALKGGDKAELTGLINQLQRVIANTDPVV